MRAMVLISTICLLLILPRVFSEEGFISLSCGSPRETTFRDKVTNISYISDAEFIATGVGSRISSSYQSKTDQNTWYIRSFPRGFRNCYTFNLTSGDRYLIRATFYHGGYDNNPLTNFQLHLGPNRWETVSTANETDEKSFEMIHLLTTDRLQVCLVNTGGSPPFISALELRKISTEAYMNHTSYRESLQTFLRADVGSVSNQSLRYRENDYVSDAFDRIWRPYNLESWSLISTNKSVHVENSYRPPETAMVTASVPTDPYAPLSVSLTGVDPASRFFVFFHLSEIQELHSNETREFTIMYNGWPYYGPFKPKRLVITTVRPNYKAGPNANGQYEFSFERTEKSTLPPLLNAMEVYLVKSLSQQETGQKEVDAMNLVKFGYGVKKIDWEGDPCAPQEYRWSGVNCSYMDNEPPKIIALNLTGCGLTGEILDSLSNLTSLQVLDLSNNRLTGSVPEFLAKMDTLKLINLSNNQLNGTIPTSLRDKVFNRSISLSIEGNPRLCSLESCTNTNNKRLIKIVASTVGASIFLALVATAAFIVLKRKRRATLDDNNLQQSSSPDISNNLFAYEDLAQATGNFSSTNLIGRGGFGDVHRGILPDGTEVAVKQLNPGSEQGEREFQTEIETISRVHHRHLVSLLGYCTTGAQRLLVYEFVPNNTLEFHLHKKGRPVMEWAKRMKIALGSAKGLSYLHEDCHPKTFHRDIKLSNILIDNSFEAKLADFGLARSCSDTETHVSTRIMGTFGYLAPEYAASGKLTDKSDVFSFGVVLLEIITGRLPIDKLSPFDDDNSIVDWAKPLMIKALNDGNFDDLVDPRLERDFDINEMTRVVACAAASVRHSAKRRPKMSQIVRALEGSISLDDLTEGVDTSSDYCSTQYKHDLKKFRKMALESQTFGSSGQTSENGQNTSGSSSTN